MARMALRIGEELILKLIRAFLNAGAMEHGQVSPIDEGTPQRSPLVPHWRAYGLEGAISGYTGDRGEGG